MSCYSPPHAILRYYKKYILVTILGIDRMQFYTALKNVLEKKSFFLDHELSFLRNIELFPEFESDSNSVTLLGLTSYQFQEEVRKVAHIKLVFYKTIIRLFMYRSHYGLNYWSLWVSKENHSE